MATISSRQPPPPCAGVFACSRAGCLGSGAGLGSRNLRGGGRGTAARDRIERGDPSLNFTSQERWRRLCGLGMGKRAGARVEAALSRERGRPDPELAVVEVPSHFSSPLKVNQLGASRGFTSLRYASGFAFVSLGLLGPSPGPGLEPPATSSCPYCPRPIS